MTFYRALTPYYDDIFPTNRKAVHFLASHFKRGGSLLDVGAGTGTMAANLSTEGFHVTAAEPEEAMAKQISKKAANPPIVVQTKPMQNVDEIEGQFDGIYCVGNTLVHLPNVAEIGQFLSKVYRKLRDDGVFICQIVNFEKVIAQQAFSFPVIKKEGFEFRRHYDIVDEHVLFTAAFTPSEETFSSVTSLYPATAAQLLPLLEGCGFRSIETYGNYEKDPFSANSPALIIVATK